MITAKEARGLKQIKIALDKLDVLIRQAALDGLNFVVFPDGKLTLETDFNSTTVPSPGPGVSELSKHLKELGYETEWKMISRVEEDSFGVTDEYEYKSPVLYDVWGLFVRW